MDRNEHQPGLDATDFFTELYPLFMLFRWLGCGSFTMAGSAHNRRFIPITNRLYKAIPFVGLAFASVTFVFKESLDRKLIGMWFLFVFRFYSSIGFIFAMAIARGYRSDKVKYIFQLFMDIDREMLRLGMRVDHKLVQKKAATGLAAQGAILLAFRGFALYLQTDLRTTAHLLIAVYRLLCCYGARILIYCLAARFRVVNDYLKTRMVDSIRFRDLASLYMMLQDMTKALSKYYSLIVLLELSVDFSSLVEICYESWRKIWLEDASSLEGITLFSLWSVYTLAGVISLVYVGDKIPKYVRETKRQLLKITLTDKCFRNTDEIIAFSHQLFYSDGAIRIGGFMTIDFSLVFSVAAALNTYLVILIQFDLAGVKSAL